jgi:GDP/UDP-N,N'-diacetylbacillosamine 2-epimerase (hydrolysing)
VLREIQERSSLELDLLLTGMHLSPEFGLTFRRIEADGFRIDSKVEMLLSSDSEEGIALSIGVGVMGFARAFATRRPDVLVLLGDRFESLAAAVAAMTSRIPIAHISGGQTTEGAVDESIRHAITKMSHLHFTHMPEYKRRIVQMGEDPDRVFVFGTPSIDGIRRMPLMTAEETGATLGLDLSRPTIVVVYHPVTLEAGSAEWQMDELLAALAGRDLQVVFIMPNADAGGRVIFRKIDEFVRATPAARAFVNLERPVYLNLLRVARAIVGNSSSGIIEAAEFRLPAVDIGDRQRGRVRGRNVVDCAPSKAAIAAALDRALDPAFRAALADLVNPYGDGSASKKIVDVLEHHALDEALLKKRFYTLKGTLADD